MKLKVTREFYIPKEAGVVTLEFPEINAVAYLWEKDGKLFSKGFEGKTIKPSFYFRFTANERRMQSLKEWVDNCKARVASKVAKKAEKKAIAETISVGDIFVNSWGYDQTNIDYYQVVEVKPSGKSAVIRKIGYANKEETGFMSGNCSPAPGKFVGEPMLKMVQCYSNKPCFKIHEWGSYAYPCAKDDVSNWSSYA